MDIAIVCLDCRGNLPLVDGLVCHRCFSRRAHERAVPEARGKRYIAFGSHLPLLDKTGRKCGGLVLAKQPSPVVLTCCTNVAITNMDACPACFFHRQNRIKSRL